MNRRALFPLMTTRKTARERDIRDTQPGNTPPCRDTCFLFAVWGNGQVWPQKSTLTDKNWSSREEPNFTKLVNEEGETATNRPGSVRCGAGPWLLGRASNGALDVSHQQRASRICAKVT